MSDVPKRLSQLSSTSLILAGATLLFWGLVIHQPPVFRLELNQCEGEINAGCFVSFFVAIFWLRSVALSTGSLVLALAARRWKPALIGVMALGMALFILFNAPEADAMLRPDDRAISSFREIHTAEVIYLSASHGTYGTIDTLVREDLISTRFMKPELTQYTYLVDVHAKGYVVTATPVGPHSASQGCWEYVATGDGITRYSNDPRKAPPGRAGTPFCR